MGHAHEGSLLYRVAPEHAAGMLALLVLPVVLWLLRRTLIAGARRNVRVTVRLLEGWRDAASTVRAVSVLMLATAAIHLGLAAGHAGAAPVLAVLFLVNGLAFALLSALALVVKSWRWPAALLLTATILAYLIALARGEAPDEAGVLTKLIEIAALGLLLIPSRTVRVARRRLRWVLASTSVVGLTVVVGVFAWGAAFHVAQVEARAEGAPAGGHSHGRSPMPGTVLGHPAGGPPTADQQAAAARLLAETRAAIARYEDQSAALADGFKLSTPEGATVHLRHEGHVKDGRTFDPERPEGLVYANTVHGPVLLGAVYEMPRPGVHGPAIGGALTPWHAHEMICVSLTPLTLSGIATPFGRCPTGSVTIAATSEMIHVWTAPNPGGPFGDLDENWVKRLVRDGVTAGR